MRWVGGGEIIREKEDNTLTSGLQKKETFYHRTLSRLIFKSGSVSKRVPNRCWYNCCHAPHSLQPPPPTTLLLTHSIHLASQGGGGGGGLRLWMAPIWPQLMGVIVGIVHFVSDPGDAGES